jgi:hypothetical protein
VKTSWSNLDKSGKSSEQGCGSKRAVLLMAVMTMKLPAMSARNS